MLTKGQDGRDANSEMVTSDVVNLGILDELPDLRGLEVLKLVVVGGSKLGDHRAVMASDNNGAAASRVVRLNTIFSANTALGLASVTELVRGSILPNATDVDGGLGRKDVLRAHTVRDGSFDGLIQHRTWAPRAAF